MNVWGVILFCAVMLGLIVHTVHVVRETRARMRHAREQRAAWLESERKAKARSEKLRFKDLT